MTGDELRVLDKAILASVNLRIFSRSFSLTLESLKARRFFGDGSICPP